MRVADAHEPVRHPAELKLPVTHLETTSMFKILVPVIARRPDRRPGFRR